MTDDLRRSGSTPEASTSGADVIARAKAALEGVTPGPWDAAEAFDASFVCAGYGRVSETWIVRLDNRPGRVKDRADARFIAAARELIPALIARVEHLETERHR